MKTCSKCGDNLPDSAFRLRKDRGVPHSICKGCESAYGKAHRGTPEGRASRMWGGIVSRSGNADGWHPTYENVEVRITREEFIAWVLPLLQDWYRTTPTSTPTIDRIDNDGHYELGNLRLLPAELNTHYRGSNKNVHAPAGMAWCYLCTSYRPVECFHRDARRPNGRQRRCKDCTYNKYMKGKYRLPNSDEIASIIARHRAGETGYRISKDCGRSMAYVYRIIRNAQA